MPDALSLPQSELPEEIATAIADLETEAELYAGSFVDRDSVAKVRSALTAAILSRLGEAEARREEALKELHVAWLTHSAAVIFRDERDGAVARVERLEEALRECVIQIEYEHGKFGRTGSGETVLARVRSLLAETA